MRPGRGTHPPPLPVAPVLYARVDEDEAGKHNTRTHIMGSGCTEPVGRSKPKLSIVHVLLVVVLYNSLAKANCIILEAGLVQFISILTLPFYTRLHSNRARMYTLSKCHVISYAEYYSIH